MVKLQRLKNSLQFLLIVIYLINKIKLVPWDYKLKANIEYKKMLNGIVNYNFESNTGFIKLKKDPVGEDFN